MALVIAVMGESGSGKTTSMRNLPPEETYYIDADGKGLSWKGWRSAYNPEKKNYMATSDQEKIIGLLSNISNKGTGIKNVVIDTMNGIMVDDEFRRMGEKNYDKWMDLAAAVYGIVSLAPKLRDDLNIICCFHAQVERDDSGNHVFTRIQTSGKKLNKIVLETKFTTVLHARCHNGQYIFETRSNNSTAKTPMGAFETMEIPNDITLVIKALEEYR